MKNSKVRAATILMALLVVLAGCKNPTQKDAEERGTGSETRERTTATYTVTYDANGATNGTAPDAQTKIHGESLALAENTGNLVRTGYNFAGWNTQADGDGTTYAAGASYTTNADVTLYARWTPWPIPIEPIEPIEPIVPIEPIDPIEPIVPIEPIDPIEPIVPL